MKNSMSPQNYIWEMEKTMVDKINTSPDGAISEQGGESSTPEFVTKTELNAMINGFRKSIKKDLEESLKAQTPPKEEVEAAPKSKKEVDPEKEEMKAQLKQVLAERAQERAELQGRKLNESLSEMLVENGIDQKHVKHAIAYLKQEKSVKYDEDGVLKMKVGFDEVDLHEAVKSWAKTDEAKLYMSPKGAVGSGQKGAVKGSAVKTTADGVQVDWSAFAQNVFNKS